MILYFTATGNGKYMADALGEDEKKYSIGELLKEGRYELPEKPTDRLILISPVYFWGVPVPVVRFLEKLTGFDADGDLYVSLVLHCGGGTGNTANALKKLCERAGIRVSSVYSVKMPDNYSPAFPLPTREEAEKTIEKAQSELAYIREQLDKKVCGDFDALKGKLPAVQSAFSYPMYHLMRRTSLFKASDQCVGCGLCERVCPENAIQTDTGKPVWVKKKCAQCLACVNRCPVNAITCGPVSRKHGQYVNPYVKW